VNGRRFGTAGISNLESSSRKAIDPKFSPRSLASCAPGGSENEGSSPQSAAAKIRGRASRRASFFTVVSSAGSLDHPDSGRAIASMNGSKCGSGPQVQHMLRRPALHQSLPFSIPQPELRSGSIVRFSHSRLGAVK